MSEFGQETDLKNNYIDIWGDTCAVGANPQNDDSLPFGQMTEQEAFEHAQSCVKNNAFDQRGAFSKSAIQNKFPQLFN